MLVMHSRQSIPPLQGFPAKENCLLQRVAQSFCDSICVIVFSLLLAGNIAREKVATFIFLIYWSFFAGMMLWSKLVSFKSNLQTVTRNVSTWSGVNWWIIEETKTFPTLFGSGLVLFGCAESLFLEHISIFTKAFCYSSVTGQYEWFIILLPHKLHLWGSPVVVCSFSLFLFYFCMWQKAIYSINSEFSAFTDLPLHSSSSI